MGDCNHSRYVVKNSITHAEDPGNPWFTTSGNAAGQRGNVATSFGGTYTYQTAIDSWMGGPFHAIGILDPRLTQTSFGIYTEGSKSGATLDVFDIDFNKTATTPIFYPADQKVMPLTQYGGGESPNPLATCGPDYVTPTGPPIILQTVSAPGAVSGSITRIGTGILSSCVYTGDTYPNDPFQGNLILSSRNAVVMIPRDPLTNGIYSVTINASGGPYTWSFAVGLQSITVSPPSFSTASSSPQQFTATGNFAPGNGVTTMDISAAVTWTSSNTAVATVNASGLASPGTAGTSTITASFGAVSGTASFTVTYSLPAKPTGATQTGNPMPLPGQHPPGGTSGNPNPLPSSRP